MDSTLRILTPAPGTGPLRSRPPRRHRFRRQRLQRPAPLLSVTTDLRRLAGRRPLCVLDDANLRISLEELGRRLSYRRLLQALRGVCPNLSAYSVLTTPAGDMRRYRYLRSRGWCALAIGEEHVDTVNGPVRKANADMDLVFLLASRLTVSRHDSILLGTGDGDLALAIARGIRRRQRPLPVYTLSVPGSTSHRILVRNHPHLFAGNILVGRDLTRPLARPRRRRRGR